MPRSRAIASSRDTYCVKSQTAGDIHLGLVFQVVGHGATSINRAMRSSEIFTIANSHLLIINMV